MGFKVWYGLVDESGNAYMGVNVASIRLSKSPKSVEDILKKVYRKEQRILECVQVDSLLLYPDLEAVHARKEPLAAIDDITILGSSSSQSIAIVVPTRPLWYAFIDDEGKPYLNLPMDFTRITYGVTTIEGIFNELYALNTLVITGLIAQVKIYRDKEAFMSGKPSLDMSASARSLTTSAERPLAVIVPSRVIRCWLVTEDGQVYLQTPPTKLRISYECRSVEGLLDAVVLSHPDILAGVRSRDLRFHPCEMSFKPSTKPMKHTTPMISLEWWPMPEFMAVVPPRQMWFALFSEDGSSYFSAPVKSVQVDVDVARVRGLRREAHSANQSLLNGVQESDLKIYRDQATLCEREMSLGDTDFAVAYGLTASNPLAVMVPSRKIWFKLYEECGKLYFFGGMESVWLESGVLTVQDFLTKVYQAN